MTSPAVPWKVTPPGGEDACNSFPRRQLLWMVLIALGVRLLVIPFVIGDQLDPKRDHWQFGWETGRLARSVAEGHGYSSPLFGDTGPSAWMTPLYPLILAGVFKIFGVYSKASAWFILGLNSLFSALTCIPVVLAASLSFGRKVARVAGWLWAFFPYAIFLSAGVVWGRTLDAMLMAFVFWLTLRLKNEDHWRLWIVWGVVCGVSALANPAILTPLPGLLVWILYGKGQHSAARLRRAATAMILMVLLISPWTIRNTMTFHRFVPLRSNFWLVFWQGNTGDTSDLYPDWANPPHSPSEMAELQRVGELQYMEEKRAQALSFVSAHPGLFAWISVRRFGFTWTGFWSLSHPYVDNEPFQIPNTVLYTLLTVSMLAGIRFAWKRSKDLAACYGWVLLSFPAIYYVTHPGVDYRHPIDPLIVVLCALAWVELRLRRRATPTASLEAES